MVVEASAVEEGRLVTARFFVLCNFLVNAIGASEFVLCRRGSNATQ